ncbi:hypothetical protein B0T17DRAFT_613742 [Bombardia bombarda]|uniref:Uncharacterized protein n=1 Tax=Bombardia bombarda TaxID=252184 RepID=A0AA40CG02_9PEZI|nr:hypothetical protein B0T17DRAFT_613742 [Bombardia bombarda]
MNDRARSVEVVGVNDRSRSRAPSPPSIVSCEVRSKWISLPDFEVQEIEPPVMNDKRNRTNASNGSNTRLLRLSTIVTVVDSVPVPAGGVLTPPPGVANLNDGSRDHGTVRRLGAATHNRDRSPARERAPVRERSPLGENRGRGQAKDTTTANGRAEEQDHTQSENQDRIRAEQQDHRGGRDAIEEGNEGGFRKGQFTNCHFTGSSNIFFSHIVHKWAKKDENEVHPVVGGGEVRPAEQQ